MRFRDIPPITPRGAYAVEVAWSHLLDHLERERREGLDTDPDFQRAHVWTEQQQIRYVEYILQGGKSGRDIWLNQLDYQHGGKGPYVLIDGKQRLNAACRFLKNEIPAFGHYLREYQDDLDTVTVRFTWNICELPTRADVLQLYINFNRGGTIHSDAEIERVRGLLELERGRLRDKV